MPRLRRSSSQRPTSATVPASTPTTRRLPPLPRCTTSVPDSGSKSFALSASASPIRKPHRHSTAISARLRTPVGARLEQRRISSSTSPPVSRSASSPEPFPRPIRASSPLARQGPVAPWFQDARPRAPSLPSLGRLGQPERGEREGVAHRDNESRGRGAGHAGRGLRVVLGRARPPGDRAGPPGRRPRRPSAPSRSCSGSRRSAPRPSCSRSSGPPPATGRRSGRASRSRSATTWRPGGEGTFSAPGEGAETSSSAAPPGA
jgi:hypothetical protein